MERLAHRDAVPIRPGAGGAEGVGSAARKFILLGENEPLRMESTMASSPFHAHPLTTRVWRRYAATDGRSLLSRFEGPGTIPERCCACSSRRTVVKIGARNASGRMRESDFATRAGRRRAWSRRCTAQRPSTPTPSGRFACSDGRRGAGRSGRRRRPIRDTALGYRLCTLRHGGLCPWRRVAASRDMR